MEPLYKENDQLRDSANVYHADLFLSRYIYFGQQLISLHFRFWHYSTTVTWQLANNNRIAVV